MIYVSSACIKKINIAEIVLKLAENNIKNIELSGGTVYYDELESDIKRLKKIYGLNYACHAYFPPHEIPIVINLASCNDQIYQQSIDHYIRCIEMLKRIDCNKLSIHAGFLIEIEAHELGKKIRSRVVYDESKAYDRFCTAYEFIKKLCDENGIILYLENNVLSAENYQGFDNHNYMMMTDYDSVMKMKRQLDFNLLLDLGHLYVSTNTLKLDYSQECCKLKEHAKWIHISDNNGVVDEHKSLRKDSNILKEFFNVFTPDSNITLETAGTIEEILESLSIISMREER